MMIAMQYGFSFPQQYDMGLIADRVAQKGHLFDDWPNLVFKAFLAASREDPQVRSDHNLYAPFYLWRDTQALHDFLASPAFAAVCEAFGRPAVRLWIPVVEQRKAGWAGAAVATRECVAIGAQPLAERWVQERALAAQWLADANVEAVVIGFDPQNWQLIRMKFHRHVEACNATAATQHYQILHLSQPNL
ncbi:DUF4865 family protein [Pseudomonas sp. M47T1]|uniref:DUF4865 family protein n=1 Tax=Pseudomonas sp. M47T1 TaxID=1179778 RepID=UPI00030B4039|nr:DUF4865 family protein [Pseudomonas sp. M47T1]